jgi:hypothetical protein
MAATQPDLYANGTMRRCRRLACLMAACGLLCVAAGKKGKVVKLKDQTYEELSLYDAADRAILAVRCEKIEFASRQTRRERVILETRIVAGFPGKHEHQFLLSRFSQGDPLMKVGQTYLVAAYRGEWLPAWNLIEYAALDPAVAERAVKAAIEELKRRERK